MLFTDDATAGPLARDEAALDVTRVRGVSRGVRTGIAIRLGEGQAGGRRAVTRARLMLLALTDGVIE